MRRTNEGADVLAVSLTIPAKAEWLVLCRLILTGLQESRAIDGETLADLKLAVTEACSNSVRHAYADGGVGSVDVRYELGPGYVAVEVLDRGRGFHFELPPPGVLALQKGELREDEMGLAIIRALVDELEIDAGPDGRGTRISFRKYLA